MTLEEMLAIAVDWSIENPDVVTRIGMGILAVVVGLIVAIWRPVLFHGWGEQAIEDDDA